VIETILKNIQLSRHFTALEFANSKDGFALKLPRIELVEKLQRLRDIVGPIRVTSGYRTEKFNASIGGARNSNHLLGLATDIVFDFTNWSEIALLEIVEKTGFNNLGIYYDKNNKIMWLHVDIGKAWNTGNGWNKYRAMSVKVYRQ
jgi:uncharacterized protein YcbK (DUF882 family)